MTARQKDKAGKIPLQFAAANIASLFDVLDAIAFTDGPTLGAIAEFADIDPRTAGKVLKNARLIGLVTSVDEQRYFMNAPYPYKGSTEQKRAVVREALLRLPLIVSSRQFLSLQNDLPTATRRAAIVNGEEKYNQTALAPLVNWAQSFKVFDLDVRIERLVDEAVQEKQTRHETHRQDRVAFISHSTLDKPFVRQLAVDLLAAGVKVWIDEQRIVVGDSIPEKVAQGVAESDFFVVVLSKNSVQSPWVTKELNHALVKEIERRRVTMYPIRLDDAPIPETIKDKKYANFSVSYARGLEELLNAIKSQEVTGDGRK